MCLLLRFWRHFQGLIPGQDFLFLYQLHARVYTHTHIHTHTHRHPFLPLTEAEPFFCSILLATQLQANQAGRDNVLACWCSPEHTSRAQETTQRHHCTQTTVTRLYPHIYSVSCDQAAQLSQQRQNEWRVYLITPTDIETLLTGQHYKLQTPIIIPSNL